MLAKPECFSPPNEVCCWRGAVKTGQASRWSCWPGQVLARRRGGAAGQGRCWRGAVEELLAGTSVLAGRREDWPGAEVELLARAGAGQGAAAGRREDSQAPWRRGWPGAVAKRLARTPWRRAIGKQLRAEVPMRQHREETAGQADVEEQGRQCRIAKAASATSGRQVFPRRLPASGRQASCAQIAAGGD